MREVEKDWEIVSTRRRVTCAPVVRVDNEAIRAAAGVGAISVHTDAVLSVTIMGRSGAGTLINIVTFESVVVQCLTRATGTSVRA